jgi:hypothetical protein
MNVSAVVDVQRATADEPTVKFGRGPEWPIVALVLLYPLWWALGLSVLVFQILAVPMLVHLVRNRRAISVPPGFGFWLAFLAWAALSLLLVWYDPPGTATDPVGQRLLVAVFRYSQYVSLGIILLFIGNLPRGRLSAQRFGWLLGLIFAYGVIGGLAAVVAPNFEFTSVVEMLLPSQIVAEPWVGSMVHPSLAQVQDFIGEEVGRPAAPFGYTNMWGAVLAMLLPWYFVTWILRGEGRRKAAAIALLALGIIPAVVSLNRGLWVALAVMLVITGVREFLAGRLTVLVALVAGVAIALPLIALSPLGGLITERLENQHSNEIREMTTQRALEISTYSPLIGYGTTRDTIGSHRSIAIGATVDCPKCGNVPLGQNGQFWLVLVAQGWIGLILFYGMFVTMLVRWWRRRNALVAAGTMSLLIALLMTTYYDMMVVPLAIMFMSLAGLWLAAADGEDGSTADPDGDPAVERIAPPGV